MERDFSDFEVVPATKEDIPTLVDFIVQEAIEAEGREPNSELVELITRGVSAPFDDPRLARYWKLVHKPTDRRIAGSISIVTEWSDWNSTNYWWIQSMFLVDEFRGKGLMDFLIKQVEEQGRKEGAKELRLYVHTENKRAVRAYEKVGFSEPPYRIMSKTL